MNKKDHKYNLFQTAITLTQIEHPIFFSLCLAHEIIFQPIVKTLNC